MNAEKPLKAKSIRLELRVPCDIRFRPVLAAISDRMALYLGFSRSEAAEFVKTIIQVTDVALDHRVATEYTSLDLTFATNDEEIEIRVRYLCEREDQPVTDRPGIERFLSGRGDAQSPLAIIQRTMEQVEFGFDEGVEFCALRKKLPEEQ